MITLQPAGASRIVWTHSQASALFLSTFKGKLAFANEFARLVLSLIVPPTEAMLSNYLLTMAQTGAQGARICEQMLPTLSPCGTIGDLSTIRTSTSRLQVSTVLQLQ